MVCLMLWAFALVRLVPSLAAASGVPLGVYFGDEYISAAQWTTDDTSGPKLLAMVRGSASYREYLADTLAHDGERILHRGSEYVRGTRGQLVAAPPETHDHERAKFIFEDALQSLKTELHALHPELDVQFGAWSHPEHFNRSSIEAAGAAMRAVDRGILKSWQRVGFTNAARLAYSLNSCAGLDLPAHSCDLEEDVHLVLILNRNHGRLDFYVLQVTEWFHGKEYADRVSLERSQNASDQAGRGFHQHMVEALRRMKASDFYNGPPRPNNGTPVPHRIEDIRAVVMSGDTPSTSLAEARDALLEVMPELRHRLRDTIDPAFVPALGAARRAHIQHQTPGMLEDPGSWSHPQHGGSEPASPHDEL